MPKEILIKNIKMLRADNLLTIRQFADKIDVSFDTVRMWMVYFALPQTEHLVKISTAFNVSIDYLCCEKLNEMSKVEIRRNYIYVQERLNTVNPKR